MQPSQAIYAGVGLRSDAILGRPPNAEIGLPVLPPDSFQPQRFISDTFDVAPDACPAKYGLLYIVTCGRSSMGQIGLFLVILLRRNGAVSGS